LGLNQFSLKNKIPNKYYKNILKPLNNPKTSQDNPKKYENQLNENSLNWVWSIFVGKIKVQKPGQLNLHCQKKSIVTMNNEFFCWKVAHPITFSLLAIF